MLTRSLLRQIRSSLGRFLAIFSIIALGVGFFAGLRVAKSAMLETADEYLTELHLYDFRLISTLGLTDEDVAALARTEGVSGAYGSVSADVLCAMNTGSDAALHALTLLDGVNGVELVAGRLPEKDDECVVDARLFSDDQIGQQLELSADNPDDTRAMFAHDSYTIVGTVNSSYYVNFERGSTSLGGGRVSGFCCLLPGGFDSEYYTEMYLTIPYAGEIYTDEYEDTIDALRPKVRRALDDRAALRYASIRDEAQAEIDKAQNELDDNRAEYEQKRSDALAELADAKAQLDDTKSQLDDAQAAIDGGRADLDAQRADLTAQLDAMAEKLAASKTQLDDAAEQLSSVQGMYHAALAVMQGVNAALGTAYAEPSVLMDDVLAGTEPVYSAVNAAMTDGITAQQFAAAYKTAESAIGEPLTAEAIATMQSDYDDGRAQYDAGQAQLTAARAEAQSQFDAAEQQLDASEQELADGWAQYTDGLGEYESAYADAQNEFADAEQKLADGQNEIDENAAKLDDLEAPVTYVLDRSANIGYACLENDAGIVEGVSRVFPLFFFLVAALVCVTTMTRMVDEQRTQNGVLKALGYGNAAISGQYLIYAGSASAIGCIVGFLIGSRFMPMMLWEVYMIMYTIDRPVAFVLDWKLFTLCSVMYLACALGATYFVCRRDLRSPAAELIRPRSPKAGKRILIERVKFLWKRVPFLHKVSIRNILRYKKRMVMMILGIGGCTALLLTGFGIRDSIANIVDFQYDEIELYDCAVTFQHAPTDAGRAALALSCGSDASEIRYVHEGSMDLSAGGQTQTVNLIAADAPLDGFWDLHAGDKPVAWPEAGQAVINNRLARTCGVAVGDEITLHDSEYNALNVTVSGIFDNYIYDYVIVPTETYTAQLGAPEQRTAYVLAADGADVHALSAKILSTDNVASVSVNADMRVRVGNMFQSLDYIVLIVLVCAGALAFIVLYNLTNISITERQREIATLKVLGFYPNESAAYVFRENLVLTGISALCGLPMGILLHRYVMAQIKINAVNFECRIAPVSFVLAVALTFVFAIVVAFFLFFKLDRINMAESLKSIE